MSARNLPFALIFLALGLALGFLFSPRSREAPKDGDRSALEAIDARLERLEQALGRERAGAVLQAAAPPVLQEATASAPPTPERVPVATEREPAIEETGQQPIAEELAGLRAAMESLRQAVAEHALPARLPTLEMIRGAPEPSMEALESVHGRAYAGGAIRKAMEESVRWMSQDEVLASYGRPSNVWNNGTWKYDLPRHNPDYPRYVEFHFVENYVTGVQCYGGP